MVRRLLLLVVVGRLAWTTDLRLRGWRVAALKLERVKADEVDAVVATQAARAAMDAVEILMMPLNSTIQY